jgi:hypothetical protein
MEGNVAAALPVLPNARAYERRAVMRTRVHEAMSPPGDRRTIRTGRPSTSEARQEQVLLSRASIALIETQVVVDRLRQQPVHTMHYRAAMGDVSV